MHILESDVPPDGSPNPQVIYEFNFESLFGLIETTLDSKSWTRPSSTPTHVSQNISIWTPHFLHLILNYSHLGLSGRIPLLRCLKGKRAIQPFNKMLMDSKIQQLNFLKLILFQTTLKMIHTSLNFWIKTMSIDLVQKFRGEHQPQIQIVMGEKQNPFFDVGSSADQELPRLHIWTKDHP